MSFAHRLAHERTFKGWTPEQLAQASGVSAFQIGRIEQSRVEASAEAMERLATALGVDLKAAPSQAQAQAPAPLAEPTRPEAPAPTAPPAAQPVLLHLPPALQQQLEAAAKAHGRSLHGEVLARLEASLAGGSVEAPPAQVPAAAAAPASPATSPLTLSEADLAHLTGLVAQRLRALQNAAGQ